MKLMIILQKMEAHQEAVMAVQVIMEHQMAMIL